MQHSSPHEMIHTHQMALLPGAWGIYLNELFRRISTSMVGLFIPLYIYKETGELISIPTYYLIYSSMAFVSYIPGALIIKRVGIDRGLAIGSVLRAIFLYSLIFAKDYHQLFWVSAFFFGVTQPFDWLPHYYALAKTAKYGRRFGSVASFSRIFTRLGSTLGPLVGGLCIQLFGFDTLYIMAGSLIVVAGIMPFLDSFEKVGMHVSVTEVWKRICDPGIIKHVVVFAVENADGIVSAMIWPIFLYKAIGSYSGSGALETTTLMVGIGGSYIVQTVLKHKKYNIMRWGTILLILGWTGRLLVHSPNGLWVANLGYLLGAAFLFTPIWTLLYARSTAKKYTMEFWLVRGFVGDGLMMLFCLAMYWAIKASIDFRTIIAILIVVISSGMVFPWIHRDYIRKYG